MKSSTFDTQHGPMMVIADDHAIYLLEFMDCKKLEREMSRIKNKTKSAISPGRTPPMNTIEREIKQYFSGELITFNTPYVLLGSPFQNKVWEELKKIPYGETCSYADVAKAIRKPTAFRAVANANGANPLAIIIPCHRVINTNGALGGYGRGIAMKKWLIEHERN